MGPRPPRSTRTDTLFPYSTLVRSGGALYRHFEGAELEDVMLQAYWKSPATAEHYLQVMRIAKVAGHDVLSEAEYRAWNELPLQHLQRLVSLNRSEEHTSELQSLMRTSYAVFCLKKKKIQRVT